MHARRVRPDTGPIGPPPPRRGRPVGGAPGARSGCSTAAGAWPRCSSSRRSCSCSSSRACSSTQSPDRLAAWVVSPDVLATLLTLNLILLALAPAGRRPGVPRHAPAGPDRASRHRRAWPSSSLLVVLPHVVVYRYGTALRRHVRPGLPEAVCRATTRGAEPPAGPGTTSGSTSCSSASTSPAERREPDRHDDGRLARPGRADRLARVGPARPGRRRRSATATTSGRSSTR